VIGVITLVCAMAYRAFIAKHTGGSGHSGGGY
jgi:hypothetical protein